MCSCCLFPFWIVLSAFDYLNLDKKGREPPRQPSAIATP
jgi:hypothetical protein